MVKDMFNYHAHTPLCHHAYGNPEEYIKIAIKNGFKELGFADHSPWQFKSGYISHMRMPFEKLDYYIQTLKDLKVKYQDQISIKIGLECEYFEQYLPNLRNTLKTKDIDYIILGNHFDGTEEDGIYYGYSLSDQDLINYVDQCIKAINTGMYSYIAHPDLPNYNPNSKLYLEQMDRLCAYAAKHDVPLEFNLLGFEEHRQYPAKQFWEIASKHHNKCIIGFDAHEPKSLDNLRLFNEAFDYLSSLDVEIVDHIKFLDKNKI